MRLEYFQLIDRIVDLDLAEQTIRTEAPPSDPSAIVGAVSDPGQVMRFAPRLMANVDGATGSGGIGGVSAGVGVATGAAVVVEAP